MELKDAEEAQVAAGELVALLAAYEDELMSMERNAQGVAPLRRVVGEALARACECLAAPMARAQTSVAGPPRRWAEWS